MKNFKKFIKKINEETENNYENLIDEIFNNRLETTNKSNENYNEDNE